MPVQLGAHRGLSSTPLVSLHIAILTVQQQNPILGINGQLQLTYGNNERNPFEQR